MDQDKILQFPTMQQLFDFQKSIGLRTFQINTINCTLQAKLTEAQLQQALSQMHAVLYSHQKTA